MSPDELYEATRGVWKLGERRTRARFALAVFENVVREVFQVNAWHPGGTTPYNTRSTADLTIPGRWEFTGTVAPDDVRNRYLNGSVAAYFRKGLQSPVIYQNI